MGSEKNQLLQNNEELAQEILKVLGTPSNLACIKAVNVFHDWYRVNVRVVKEHKQMLQVTSISDSFFVRYKDGKICGGDEIVKRYE